MHAALMWLKEENAARSEIGSRLGYESEAAFSRAFKKLVGQAPATWRRGAVPLAREYSGAPRD